MQPYYIIIIHNITNYLDMMFQATELMQVQINLESFCGSLIATITLFQASTLKCNGSP